MEPIITTISIASFLAGCLLKAGEKVSEKTIETVFEHKKELLESFSGLFKQELITLGLSDNASLEEVQRKLETKPEIVRQALEKLKDEPELLREFNEQFRIETGGMTINAEKIGQVIRDNHGTINQIVNF